VSKKPSGLSSEDRRLWRRVAETIKTRKPLPQADEAASAPIEPAHSRAAAPKAAPAKTRREAHAPPQHRGNEKRVRRGKLSIDATLDLHGHTQVTGRAALARFLDAAQARGALTVIVVTGVGRGGEGVLKRCLPLWLSEPHLRRVATGYAPAHRRHGGDGAFYVFLRRAETLR
jgi:DNA-nicking Smr family endonuclease